MNIPDGLKDWQHVVQCSSCKDIFWSKYSGEFVRCKCKESYVDSTTHYTRTGGRAQTLKPTLKN